MTQQPMVRCTNCGTEWYLADSSDEQPGALAVSDACPVCYFPFSSAETAPTPDMSISDLETQLGALITRARASGLASQAIVQALRDELEFAAEMSDTSRHFCVQLIDLGPQQGLILQRPAHDRRAILQNRSTN